MKTKLDEILEFLEGQLHRTDVEESDRQAIQGTLEFLDREKKINMDEWLEFKGNIYQKQKEWTEKYGIEGYNYTFEVFESERLKSIELNIEGPGYGTWVFEVQHWSEPNKRIIVNTRDVKELKLGKFEEVYEVVENSFTTKNFRETVNYLLGRNK